MEEFCGKSGAMKKNGTMLFSMGCRDYHYINMNKSWQDAQSYCREHHSDLATISNMRDNNRTLESKTNSAEKYVWIGLNYTQGAWRWSDSSNASFNNWKNGEPNRNNNCVEMLSDGRWNDGGCHHKRHFICNGEEHRDYHYINEKMSWQDAQSYCRNNYSDLATISNMTDNKKAQKKHNSTEKYVWIGLNNNNTQGAWRWSEDSSDASFYNWNKGEPNGNNNCVEMRPDGCWKDEKCTTKLPFICNDFPMILISQNKTWEEAVVHCRKYHHDLISAHNVSMRKRVQDIAENATTPYVWIGLHYTCVLDFWFWIDNEDFIQDSWDPDNDMEEFCGKSGAMKKNGTMLFSRSNTEKLNFICSLC
ncbi:Macrophage mannose receptor 1 [Merluccius polli]|uniref:Macrophage mannose receptor 1 n=1 Tax=Merluccius polli TaxID=89951 RepID=A0AA47MEA4_MERPO|nr:Macrophage mannose receptor 1 [Merluccius polli]